MKKIIMMIITLQSFGLYAQTGINYEKQLDIQRMINKGLSQNKGIISNEAQGLSYEEKDRLYDKNKKDATMPFVLNLVLGFGIGSLVQGDTTFGVITLGGELVSYTAFLVGYIDFFLNFSGGNRFYPGVDLGLVIGGALVYTVFHIVELIRPWSYSESYNQDLREALQIAMAVHPTVHYAWLTKEPVYGAVLTSYF